MQDHSTKPTMYAVANTGGMSEKPVNAADTAGTVRESSTTMDWEWRSPTGIGLFMDGSSFIFERARHESTKAM
ncbi:protein of unknown function (plasmid) [Caballeronia sp. S22]